MAGSQEKPEIGRELARIAFFSDAVFAIAIALLVLDCGGTPRVDTAR